MDDGSQKFEFGTEVKNFGANTQFLPNDFDRYTLEIEASADGRLPTVSRFNLSFSTTKGASLFTLAKLTNNSGG